MKTGMQELIEQLEKTIPEVKNGNAIDKAFWLEKEKQQIKQAYNIGGTQASDFSSEQYYNEKYGDIQK